MPLGVHEIVAGCVAYLDGEALIADQAVSDPEGGDHWCQAISLYIH